MEKEIVLEKIINALACTCSMRNETCGKVCNQKCKERQFKKQAEALLEHDIMPVDAIPAANILSDKRRLMHRIERTKKEIEKLEANRTSLSVHGHWSLGYHKGKLSVLEECLDNSKKGN